MERKPYWTGSYNHPLPPFSRSLRCAPSRAGLPSAIKQDRFATLSWWANRSCFFLWFHRGNTLFFQSVARQILYLRGCLKVLFTSTNTARAQGWGNPRGSALLCWRSRNQEVPGESLATFFSQESHPGAGRSACIGGCRDCRPRINLPGVGGAERSPHKAPGKGNFKKKRSPPAGSTQRGSRPSGRGGRTR